MLTHNTNAGGHSETDMARYDYIGLLVQTTKRMSSGKTARIPWCERKMTCLQYSDKAGAQNKMRPGKQLKALSESFMWHLLPKQTKKNNPKPPSKSCLKFAVSNVKCINIKEKSQTWWFLDEKQEEERLLANNDNPCFWATVQYIY